MLTSPFIAGLAKVVAVGVLMAGGAAGIYAVTSTQSSEDEQSVVAASSTPEQATASLTPTQTSSPTATLVPTETLSPPTNTPEPTPTTQLAIFPTPASVSDTMIIGGALWVDARPAFGEVLAFINGQQCGRGQSAALLHSDGMPTFFISIKSDAEQPGCGLPGVAVVITVGDREMNAPIEWQPGFQQPVSLVAGPAFGQFVGEVEVGDGMPTPFRIVAYIDGIVCGETGVQQIYVPQDEFLFSLVVDPREIRPGCGYPGAQVTFQAELEGQPHRALITVEWITEVPVRLPPFDVTGWVPLTPEPTYPAP